MKTKILEKEPREEKHSEAASMGLLFLSVFIVFSSSSHPQLCAARDRLAAGESISVNQTIVSAGQTFALGFFTPGNSTSNLYAGIWYNRVPRRTVVWVANRENPLTDPGGVLTVTKDGNIALLDGIGSVIWSTNLSGVAASNTSAVLLDSGNLVVRHDDGGDVWESFEHPTDTLLPGMKLRSGFSRGDGLRLASWLDATDPSPGEFVLTIDRKTSLQFYIMKSSEIYWRGPVWNGSQIMAFVVGNLRSFYVVTVQADDQDVSWTFTMTDNSLLARCVLDQTGKYSFFIWHEGVQNWTLAGSVPARPCDYYNRCGSFGTCNDAAHLPLSLCKCLDGFEPRNPKDWEMGNFTGGCVRRLQLQCDGTDGFVRFGGMKLPDQFSVMWNMSAAQCEANCSASCGCKAYAYGSSNRAASRCLIWLGELADLVQIGYRSEDLYMRLPASELENNKASSDDGFSSNKVKSLMKVIVPVLSLGMLLVGICCCFFIKGWRKSRVGKRKARKLVRLEDLDFSNALGSEKEMPDAPLLDFKSVKVATSNFCDANRLGQGGFGPVYKGKLSSGQEIAVKRLSRGSKQGYQEFANEVRLIGRLQHKNLVRLLGWSTHKDEKILIYEYMSNKSLDKFIFDPTRSPELNWEKRFRIIEGIANGLLYLHQHSRMRVIHRDLKTSNILLDSEMNPKISDFGLARIFLINQVQANTRKVVGTYGYMSPEYALDGVFSEKSDVFSFGVMLLEIITGKRSTGFYPYTNCQSLFGYAWQMWEEGRALELQDPNVNNSSRAIEVLRCIQLAMLCIQEEAADRPPMSSIVSLLSNETCPLPTPKQPAFVIGRSPNTILPSLHDRASKVSINEVTRSSVEAR